MLDIKNNSSIVFENSYFEGDDGILYNNISNGLKFYTINIKNNSLVVIKNLIIPSNDPNFYYLNNINNEQNSTLILSNIGIDIENILLRNNSTFMYEKLEKGYSNVVNINSKIFEKK